MVSFDYRESLTVNNVHAVLFFGIWLGGRVPGPLASSQGASVPAFMGVWFRWVAEGSSYTSTFVHRASCPGPDFLFIESEPCGL